MGALAALTGALTGLVVLRGLDGLGVDLTGLREMGAIPLLTSLRLGAETEGLPHQSSHSQLILYPPCYIIYRIFFQARHQSY